MDFKIQIDGNENFQMSINEEQNDDSTRNNFGLKNKFKFYDNQQIINQNGKGHENNIKVQSNKSKKNQDFSDKIINHNGNNHEEANPNVEDLRSSSFFPKTHNYDFDISNYNTNQIFLLGKILQLMIYVKDCKFSIDYNKYELPDNIGKAQTFQQNMNSYQINNILSGPQSYNARESLQFQGNNFRNSKFFPSYEYDPSTIRFYRRRKAYFSKYQQGISVDSKTWPHLVPESIVQHIARRASQSNRNDSIIDASCAVGQFSIAFANHINSVISIETDSQRYNMARNNAQVYDAQNCKYNQNERISFNEGILFYNDSSFIDDLFTVNANLSDCVFFAPHLQSQNINTLSQEQAQNYFNTDQFYQDLKQHLRKAFKIAPQVILFTPRNVKIIEIVECFTEAIKENLNKVKKCSLDIEKIFINDHLKYICFYFGEFGKDETSYQEEFKFIDQYLENCDIMNKQKKNKFNKQEIKQQIRIHQQIYTELGKFQLLNIVHKFRFHFKIENLKISEDQTLLSLFYAYLINNKFISQQRISQIISKKQQRSSAISTNTNNQLVSQEDYKSKDPKLFQIENNFRKVSSFMISKQNIIKSNVQTDSNGSPQRTRTLNQYITEDDNGFNNFDQTDSINLEYDLKQLNKNLRMIKLQDSNESHDNQLNNEINFKQFDRTLSNNSNYDQSLHNSNQKFKHIKHIKKLKDGDITNSSQKRKPTRTKTQQSIQQSKDGKLKKSKQASFDNEEQNNKNFSDSSSNKKGDQKKKFKSETETESEFEYEEYSSISKYINNSQHNNNNQVSFLRKTQRIYESKVDDQNHKNKEINKSQIGNSLQQTQEIDSQQNQDEENEDELIVFNFNFFEQNKKDVLENDNNHMNTSFNLLNTSRIIAQEINNDK